MPKVSVAWYLLIASFGYILFLQACEHKCPAIIPTVVVKTDTIKIPVETKTVKYVPTPKSVTVPDTQYPAMWIDTAAIVKAALSKIAYQDTAYTKYGYVLIVDTLHESRIESRQVTFHLEIPQVTLTSAVKPSNQFYIGPVIGGSKTFVSFGGDIMLRNKKNQIYWFSASYTSLSSTYYQFGTLRLIKF